MSFSRLQLVILGWLTLAVCANAQQLYDRNILRTVDLQFAQPDWETQLEDNKAAGTELYIPCDMTVEGVLYPNVGVRYKGNSTYWIATGAQKKPLSIDLNVFGVDQELMGHSKLVLNNQWSDTSLMREVLAYKVMQDYLPAPRANFVKIMINGANYGIYTSVEHMGADFCRDRFGSDDGFRYKAVPPDQWPDTLTPPPPPGDLALQDISHNMIRAERAYELKNRDADPNHHLRLLDTIDVLNNTTSDLLLGELGPYMDTDMAIRYLAINNALVSLDAYYSSGRNYYAIEHPRHQQMMTLPWDYNMAFGGYGGGSDLNPTAGKGDADRPLMSKLVKGGVLRQEYLWHMYNIAVTSMDPAELHAEIDALEALIDAEVQIDTRLALSYNGWKSGVSSLKNFINSRHNFLTSHSLLDIDRPDMLAHGLSNSTPSSADQVLVWAQVENAIDPIEEVHLYYRANGTFLKLAMLDDGLSGDGAAGDGIYAATLPAFPGGSTVDYYVTSKCTNSNGMRMLPDTGAHDAYQFFVTPTVGDSDVVINEIVASNDTGPVDELGDHDDWFELHNHGNSTMDLSGMWLSDELEEPMKWQIPAGTTLAPDQFLLFWADNEPAEGPLHTNFKLSSGGEELALYDVDGTTMRDFLRFGEQTTDVATARMFEGEDMWVTLPGTTPGASNEVSCGPRAFQALSVGGNTATLGLSGVPSPGASVDLQFAGFPASQPIQLRIGGQAVAQAQGNTGLTLLVDSLIQQSMLSTDANGEAIMPFTIPPDPQLVGMSFYLQAGRLGANPVATNGLEVVICP
jgi:hypothetical protein